MAKLTQRIESVPFTGTQPGDGVLEIKELSDDLGYRFVSRTVRIARNGLSRVYGVEVFRLDGQALHVDGKLTKAFRKLDEALEYIGELEDNHAGT